MCSEYDDIGLKIASATYSWRFDNVSDSWKPENMGFEVSYFALLVIMTESWRKKLLEFIELGIEKCFAWLQFRLTLKASQSESRITFL